MQPTVIASFKNKEIKEPGGLNLFPNQVDPNAPTLLLLLLGL